MKQGFFSIKDISGNQSDFDLWKDILDDKDIEEIVTIKHRLKSEKGGSGSGNFGHEGRPGEIGGSSPGSLSRIIINGTDPAAIRASLRRIPKDLHHEFQMRTLHTADSMAEMNEMIQNHLRENYNVELPKQAIGLVDRRTQEVFAQTDPFELYRQMARTMSTRIKSPEWQKASQKIRMNPEEAFSKTFSALATRSSSPDFLSIFTGEAAQSVMSFTNPASAMLEHGPIRSVLHKWGWMK